MFTKMCGQQVDVSQKLRLSLKVSIADLFILFLLPTSLLVWGFLVNLSGDMKKEFFLNHSEKKFLKVISSLPIF